MGDSSRAGPSSFNEDDDEDDYEEQNGGTSLFGFMFGNIDNAGDLDADYLDEDAKENLFALADKLGPSLTEIALTKASPTRTNTSDQDDYDEKAEDAVNYEDIDEQYDGPETKTETEFFTPTNLHSSNLNNNSNTVFDDDNYDEDYDEEEQAPAVNETNVDNKAVQIKLPDVLNEGLQQKETETSFDHEMPVLLLPKPADPETEFVEVEENDEKDKSEEKSRAPLPVLYSEDGIVILKFSEIFGVQVPPKKSKRDPQKKDRPRDTIEISEIVEEDEEVYFRTTIQNFPNKFLPKLTETESEDEFEEYPSDDGSQLVADPCHPAQPMKDDDISPSEIPFSSFSCPDIYPIDHENWESQILWGNSPQNSLDFSNQEEVELEEGENGIYENTDLGLNRDHVERLSMEKNLLDKDDAMTRFKKLSFMNKELLDGSWLDDIIWDPSETLKPKPKLIFDLQDDQMIFESLEERESENLSQIRSHASALVISKQPNRNSRVSVAYNSESQNDQLMKFNISNDDFYATRKSTAQAKSNVKKRVNGHLKVLHSIPALKLQTMKPRLSHKEMANFHRPRALWYPHFNQVVVKFQKNAINQGPMKLILMTLGGKGVKVQVNSEESLSSLKLKASKKLDFKLDENVKIYYNEKELEMDKSLADQDVRPNSVLYLVTTKINVWTKAQKLPGEDKPLRPPGAFRKKSDLSVKDGRVFLMEYCEERPLLLSNQGMGARLCTYYQKTGPSDQTASSLKSSSTKTGLGSILSLDTTDRSPFLGEISPGKTQSCLETNMFRAPVFNHKLGHTDYLLVRNAKGGISIRKIDRLYVVGQQEPHMEVFQPGTKPVQTYLNERMQTHVYREFRAREKPNCQPCISVDELGSLFPGLTDAVTRKRLHHCAVYRRAPSGRWFYVQRSDFRIPVEEELRRRMTPENVCCYESMQAGWYHLRRMGIQRLTQPTGLSATMNQLPDEAIVLAAASHIERELQITPWALTSNFIASTNQDRENLERLEIIGVGDPSGRGLGFSYARTTPKAPLSNANAKKKVVTNKNMTVTGTDADLRRLSMDAAREILLKLGVAEEDIAGRSRWHRIADIRKLSSAQALSGMQMDASALSKFARGERGQRMSFSQVQQQTKEKCQEIWDRQAQSLSAVPAQQEENNADEEGANSDLDSFAGDLENLLDAEEGEEEEEKSGNEKGNSGNMKMRRGVSQSQTEEEIEDDVEEAVVIRRMLDEDGMDMKRKNKMPMRVQVFDAENSDHLANTPHLRTPAFSKEIVMRESKEAESSISARLFLKKSVGLGEDTPILPIKKKFPIIKDGQKIYKEKTPRGENIVCGACGQVGHMRTNKNCPKFGEYKEDQQHELPDPETPNADVADQVHSRSKKLITKLSSKPQSSEPEPSESGPEKSKPLPVKFKFGLPEKSLERNLSISVVSDSETNKPTKINKLIISTSKSKPSEEFLSPRPSIKIRPPAEVSETGPRKKIIIKQPKDYSDYTDDPPRKKRVAELATPSSPQTDNNWYEVSEEERYREEQQRLYEARVYEETKRKEEIERRKMRKKKKRKHDFTGDDYLKDHRTVKKERSRMVSVGPGSSGRGERAAKRRTVVDYSDGGGGSASLTKRRKGGEVELSNILERIVDILKEQKSVSYLFVKPVTKKEAPDYFDIVERPMDLSSIKEKVRKMEYKNRDEFRHDVFQITYNAHLYNDGKNPGIPPLADQLLELCDYYLEQNQYELDEAEARIEFD